jgi:hypothetical protein
MFDIDNDLYAVSPAYRQLVRELRRVESENGALVAAYSNAINDQKRLTEVMWKMVETIEEQVSEFQVLLRDDPGAGGSGGGKRPRL